MVVRVTLLPEHIILTDIVHVQRIVVLIQKKQVVLVHHHVRVIKVRAQLLTIVIALVAGILVLMENVSALVV